MKKFLTFVAVLMIGSGLMAQDMMMGSSDKGVWVGGNVGAIVALNNDATGGGFSVQVSGEYANAFMAGPLAVNAGAELGMQSFGEAEGSTYTLTNIPINVFVNTDVGGMVGLPDGIALKPGIGLGLFSVDDNIDATDSAMRFGLHGDLGVEYMIQDNMRAGLQFRGYRVMGFADGSDDPNDFINILAKFDYFLPM